MSTSPAKSVRPTAKVTPTVRTRRTGIVFAASLATLAAALVAIQVVPGFAVAKTAKKKSQKAKPKTEFLFPVPASEIALEGHLPQRPLSPPVALEAGVSSFAPSRFTRPTYSSGLQAFQRGASPFVSLNIVTPASDEPSQRGLFWKLGLSAMSLRRTIQVTRGVGVFESRQDLNIFSARIGAEYKWSRLANDLVQPFIGLSLLPSTALATSSQLEGRVSAQGAPIEAVAGVEIHPRVSREDPWGFQNSSIGICAQSVLGSIGDSKMNGFGAQGFLRVSL